MNLSATSVNTKTFATNFLTRKQAQKLINKYGAPLYVYSEKALRTQANQVLNIAAPFGLTARYAMKANPNPQILKILQQMGIKIDASSGYEAENAIKLGFAPQDILLTSQELPKNLKELVGQGVQFTACSLNQLEACGQLFAGSKVGVRLNPGVGSGHSAKVNTGGVTSSFGIWHEYIPKIEQIAAKHSLTINRLHTHIGAGTDLAIWAEAVDITLDLASKFPLVTTADIGGGFKVGRMDNEKTTNMELVGELVHKKLTDFAAQTGRKLHLEVEPGTFMVANIGIILAQVEDLADTGKDGYKFIKLNAGMSEILRPALYASQHPIAILTDQTETDDFVIVGHCCESGDLLTTDPNDPEKIATRNLPIPKIGDIVLIGGCGAYCASMAAKGYNSFPVAKEVLI